MRAAFAIAAITMTLSVGACAQLRPEPVHTAALPGLLEPVHAAAVVEDQAIFWVSSNGCTAKSDLTPVVRRDRAASVITLRRLREDRCQTPAANGVEVRWTFQELGLQPGARVSIDNPYQMPTA